ncbi:leucine-rich repeat receptor-like serine/threonine-protein kinase At1g17230 [Glycine max]|uniref:leucine-rich repeat receptor-like serine/threonine-protein kinase At1g17230 n=1 Tax=Glycine max TaxID=3847 RepID=UPI001B356080|nr:leucine-rich repeat receptor-like serine/threonine-protein kinase At1g17230 [Glycine max]
MSLIVSLSHSVFMIQRLFAFTLLLPPDFLLHHLTFCLPPLGYTPSEPLPKTTLRFTPPLLQTLPLFIAAIAFFEKCLRHQIDATTEEITHLCGLNENYFSGEFLASVAFLHRVKVIVLSQNHISGAIPASLLNLRRLYVLYLQDNAFTGRIPGFK